MSEKKIYNQWPKANTGINLPTELMTHEMRVIHNLKYVQHKNDSINKLLIKNHAKANLFAVFNDV